MPSDLELVGQLNKWIADIEFRRDDLALTASIQGRVHEEIAWVFPDAERRFGMPTLVAAVKKNVPGCCRWGLADWHARVVHKHKRPGFTPAYIAMLGRPCNLCMKRVRNELKARVDAGRMRISDPGPQGRNRGTSSSASSVTSSSRRNDVPHPSGAACARCYAAQVAVRTAMKSRGLTASVATKVPGVARLVAAALTHTSRCRCQRRGTSN